MRQKVLFILLFSFFVCNAEAAERFIHFQKIGNSQLCLTGTTDTICYDSNDWAGVKIAVQNLRNDLITVTGSSCAPIVVGTVGKSEIAKKYKAQSKNLKGPQASSSTQSSFA